MKKEEYEFDWKVFFAIIFILGIVLFCLLALALIETQWGTKSNYKLTIQECHNETENIYYEFPRDFTPFSCPNKKIKVPCYDSKGSEILNLNCLKDAYDYSNKRCFKLAGYENSPSTLIEESSLHYTRYYWINNESLYSIDLGTYSLHLPVRPIKNQSIKQVCEEKEVDEIRFKQSCTGIACGGGFIKKSEINREWLENNCDCLIGTTCTTYNTGCRSDCKKWKCFDYEVKLL